MTFLYEFFGMILRGIYDFVGNYGFSIVLFALFAKIIMIPLTLKQHKSMQMMKFINPLQQKLQKKYASNKEKLNEEITKLYRKYNYSPFSGCLPILIQLPIIIVLFAVLRAPETYVFGDMDYSTISQSFLWIEDMTKSPWELYNTVGLTSQFFLSLIIPLISIGLTFYSQKQTSAQSVQDNQNKTMMLFLNITIAYMTFTFNQGLAIYWSLQSLFSIIQTFVMMKTVHIELPEAAAKKTKTRGSEE